MNTPTAAPRPERIAIAPSILYFGTPVVLIVTRNPDGSANITPMSSAWALGQRVVLGLLASGQGAANLRREGDCTLNIASAALWPQVERIAAVTGAAPVPAEKAAMGFRHAADKFALGGFAPVPSDLVAPPCIADCPLQFEARLAACHPAGAGPAEILTFELDVLRVHAHREIVIPGTQHIDTARWDPLFYVFRHYFGQARDLGRTWRAEA